MLVIYYVVQKSCHANIYVQNVVELEDVKKFVDSVWKEGEDQGLHK